MSEDLLERLTINCSVFTVLLLRKQQKDQIKTNKQKQQAKTICVQARQLGQSTTVFCVISGLTYKVLSFTSKSRVNLQRILPTTASPMNTIVVTFTIVLPITRSELLYYVY